MNLSLPWLHPHRADVLAALALAMRLRQPLATGFSRLAEGDPLLRPWALRLSTDLASGAPLGGVLRKHRLLDRPTAARLDAAVDPVSEFEHLSREQLTPVRGLLLIRWFPVALVGVILAPMGVVLITGVPAVFEHMYQDMGFTVPALTKLLFSSVYSGPISLLIPLAVTCLLLAVINALRGLRHLCHVWWVDVHRQAALYELTCAAVLGDDAPQRLRWPGSWFAALRLSAWRQQRPTWDRAWRTWRFLTRWRAFGPGWREAEQATTAADVLIALGFLSSNPAVAELQRARSEARNRLIDALNDARAQAYAVLMVGVGLGTMSTVIALFLPLFTAIQVLGV